MPRLNGRHVDSVAFSCCCWCCILFYSVTRCSCCFFPSFLVKYILWLHTESTPNIWNWICNQKRREKYRRLSAQVRCWKETEVYTVETKNKKPNVPHAFAAKTHTSHYAATTELATLFSLQSLVCTTALPAYFARCCRCCHRCRGRFILSPVVLFFVVVLFWFSSFQFHSCVFVLFLYDRLLSYLYLVARLV